jgi:hypothetical protein
MMAGFGSFAENIPTLQSPRWAEIPVSDKPVLVALEATRPSPLIISSRPVIISTLWCDIEEVTPEECAQVLARLREAPKDV